jgi:hemerythrin-like metal-binding protein
VSDRGHTQVAVTPELRTRLAELDREHGKLALLVERVRAAWQAGSKDQLAIALLTFYGAVFQHFPREQALMQDVGYPEAARASAAHSDILAKLGVVASSRPAARSETVQLMFSWVCDAMRTEDERFADFLRTALPAE